MSTSRAHFMKSTLRSSDLKWTVVQMANTLKEYKKWTKRFAVKYLKDDKYYFKVMHSVAEKI